MRELRLRKARQTAAHLVERYAIHRPDQLEDVAWLLRAEIIDGGLEGALARVARVDRSARIRLSDNHVEPGQRRFSIAHELGHLLLGHHGLGTCSRASEGGRAYGEDKLWEEEANVFAGDFLLPTRLVARRCEVSPVHFGVIERIAEDFGTSLVATSIRFAELTSERCAVVLSQQGKVRWVVRSPTFWPDIQRGQQVLPWSVAARYFRGKPLPRCHEEIDATAWVDGQHLRGPAEIYEDAREVPSIRSVLSLLWIPETCHALSQRHA